MELVDLSFIIAVARKEERHHGRQLCVMLNISTYNRLLRDVRKNWCDRVQALPPPRADTFQYYGHTITWSPALNKYPSGYVIGALWRGAE